LNLNFFVLLNRRFLLCSVRLSQSDRDDLVVVVVAAKCVCVCARACVFSAAATFVLFSLCLFVLVFLFCFFVSAFDSFSSLHFGVAMIGIG
jgi:hypothetical protein